MTDAQKMRCVYVIASEKSGTKIGLSTNLERRVSAVQRKKITGPCSIYFATELREDAYVLEALAHELLDSHRISGEWFDVTPEEAKVAVIHAMEKISAGYIIPRKELNALYQAALRKRERAAGIIRKLVRIPEDRAVELDRIVAEWMSQHAQQDQTNPNSNTEPKAQTP